MRLGDVATDLLDLVCLNFFLFLHVIPDGLDNGEIRSPWSTSGVVRPLVHTKLSLDFYNGKTNAWKCKLIFPIDILQQKI